MNENKLRFIVIVDDRAFITYYSQMFKVRCLTKIPIRHFDVAQYLSVLSKYNLQKKTEKKKNHFQTPTSNTIICWKANNNISTQFLLHLHDF